MTDRTPPKSTVHRDEIIVWGRESRPGCVHQLTMMSVSDSEGVNHEQEASRVLAMLRRGLPEETLYHLAAMLASNNPKSERTATNGHEDEEDDLEKVEREIEACCETGKACVRW